MMGIGEQVIEVNHTTDLFVNKDTILKRKKHISVALPLLAMMKISECICLQGVLISQHINRMWRTKQDVFVIFLRPMTVTITLTFLL